MKRALLEARAWAWLLALEVVHRCGNRGRLDGAYLWTLERACRAARDCEVRR